MPSRRAALMTLLAGPAALAGPRFRVYARCLPDHYRALATRYYEQRNRAIAALTTREKIQQRQRWVRDTFWRIIGGEPKRVPLESQVHGSFEAPGYVVSKVSYNSWPGMQIPANLYVPTNGAGPFPGVLFQMGHSLNGKAAEPYQKCCQGLARLGYVVLAFDPFGQGERTYYHVDDADEEHSRAGRQMLLTGDTMTRLQLWDAVRSLDYLAEHPKVDPKRLASTGQSGGGTLTMLLAAVDDRLACAAVSSGNTENFVCADFNSPGSTDDAEQNLIGGGPLGIDRWDLLYPMAPKPLLVLASERDDFGTYSYNYLNSGVEEFAKLRRIYETLGAPDHVQWGTTGLPHGLSHPMRLQIYSFFQAHLKHSAQIAPEPPVKPEPDSQLTVGTRAVRVAFSDPTPGPIDHAGLLKLLGLSGLPQAEATMMARDPGESGEIETIEVPSAPEVFLPAYLYLPKAAPKSVILLLEPGGRTRRWREGELCHTLASQGHAACAFDVRAVGDLMPEFPRGQAPHARSHATEEAYAWAGLMLGTPLLSQRTADILSMAAAMRKRFGPSTRLVLAASGSLCVPALCAAALDLAIRATYLNRGLISWRSILATDDYKESFANFLPGVLKTTELSFIARLIPSRRLILASPVDGSGKPVTQDEARREYGQLVEVRSQEGWTTAILSAL